MDLNDSDSGTDFFSELEGPRVLMLTGSNSIEQKSIAPDTAHFA
jgi:hypothetical protein